MQNSRFYANGLLYESFLYTILVLYNRIIISVDCNGWSGLPISLLLSHCTTGVGPNSQLPMVMPIHMYNIYDGCKKKRILLFVRKA